MNKQTFQVKITRTYFSQQFHDDLKLLFQAAGIGENKQQVVFLFDDTQVVEETFLEDINNILSTGEVRILLNFILFSQMLWLISTLKNSTISVGGELMCGNN